MPDPFFQNPIGTPFIELQSVDSTNNYALAQTHAGLAQHGTVFFAHEQVAGKGQRGKTWSAENSSSVIMSMVISPAGIDLSRQFHLSACVAVAIATFFSRYAGDATRIKWPNDLYWHDRKAGGILIENIVGGSSSPQSAISSQQSTARNWQWAIIGIGININQPSFPSQLKNPVSLRQITGQQYNTVELAKELCTIFNQNFSLLLKDGFENIYNLYQQHLYKKGQPVRFKKGSRVFEATVQSVSKQGYLVVQHATEEEFAVGEVEWLLPINKKNV